MSFRLKSLEQSKQWYLLPINGNGKPSSSIPIAKTRGDSFSFLISSEPQKGQTFIDFLFSSDIFDIL